MTGRYDPSTGDPGSPSVSSVPSRVKALFLIERSDMVVDRRGTGTAICTIAFLIPMGSAGRL